MKIVFLLSFFYTTFALAQTKYMAILGAGGEPKTSTTIFDDGLIQLGEFAKKNPEYKTDLFFNGGHSHTEFIAKEKFGEFDQSNYFTSENFEKSISNYEELIKSGKIKANDQILIHINTHGGDKNQETHQVSTIGGTVSDFNSLGGGHTVSLDRLKNLTELAEKKGIKLAIIDLSCHSGNTLALANSKTCVISGTGTHHFGFGGSYEKNFSNQFNKSLQKGKNLEEIFLAARSNYYDLSYPMISSPQGLEVQDKLYEALTPYLYFHLEKADKFIPYLEEEFLKGKECKMEEDFESLSLELQKISQSIQDSGVRSNIQVLYKSLKAYYDFNESLKEKMQQAGFSNMKTKLNFCSEIKPDPEKNIKSGKECINYFTLEQLLSIKFDRIFDFYLQRLETGTPDEQAHNLAIIECYKKAQGWKEYMIKQNPHYAEIGNFWKQFPELQAKTQELARAVNTSQQKLYIDLYKRSTKQGPNPCRDFVL